MAKNEAINGMRCPKVVTSMGAYTGQNYEREKEGAEYPSPAEWLNEVKQKVST